LTKFVFWAACWHSGHWQQLLRLCKNKAIVSQFDFIDLSKFEGAYEEGRVLYLAVFCLVTSAIVVLALNFPKELRLGHQLSYAFRGGPIKQTML